MIITIVIKVAAPIMQPGFVVVVGFSPRYLSLNMVLLCRVAEVLPRDLLCCAVLCCAALGWAVRTNSIHATYL